MCRSNIEEEQFLNNMMNSYSQVHNSRYWTEIDPFVSILASGQCLDIGCGPGLLLSDIYKRYGSKKLIGIDLSQIMLTKAKEILDEIKAETTIELIQQHLQENEKLPLGNDLILCSRLLRSFEDPLKILNSIHRSLDDGGIFVLLDWDQQPLQTYLSWFKENKQFSSRDISELVKLHRNFSRYSLEDWRTLFELSNFDIEHTFQLNPVQLVIIGKRK